MTAAAQGSTTEQQADRGALADLLTRLGWWLDGQRYDDAGSLFTEDATVHTQGGQARGLQALSDQARRIHSSFAATQHLTSGVLIDVQGDHATVRANLIALFVRDKVSPEPAAVVGERYLLAAVRTAGGWRFSRVEVAPVWRSGEIPRQS
jgi:hypothetical protein